MAKILFIKNSLIFMKYLTVLLSITLVFSQDFTDFLSLRENGDCDVPTGLKIDCGHVGTTEE